MNKNDSCLKEDELLYALALQYTQGVGAVNAKKLIANFGSAKEIFNERKDLLSKINGVGSQMLKNLNDKKNLLRAEKEIDYLQKNPQIHTQYFLDESYPSMLKHCIDAPVILFSNGTIYLQQQPIISIVGTRKITSYGDHFCKDLVAAIAPYNPIIVSGFAFGVDICAHKAAIENNLQTIAVLAHGLDEINPRPHSKYASSVCENGGFVTDFFHGEKIQKENFLKRNRIIAGLSQATIVIESAEKGGSLVTAQIANSYNRDVFAVPGRTTDRFSKGCNNLIKNNQAAILTHAQDLIQMLNWDKKVAGTKQIQKQLFVELTEEEQCIHNYLSTNGKQLIDVISAACSMPIHQLNAALFSMEMKGVLRPLPGKLFEVV
jgi:DNA processing protein